MGNMLIDRVKRCWPFLLGLCLVLPALASPMDDELLKEFKRYFKKYKESNERVEAVLALDGLDVPGVVDLLVPVLRDKDKTVVSAAIRVLGNFKSRSAIDALLLTLDESKKAAEQLALLRTLAAAGYAHDGSVVLPLLESRSWEIRRYAVEALVKTGNQAHVDPILQLATDAEVAVRVVVLDGLTTLGAEAIRPVAIAALADKAWQVRASAIATLGTIRHRDNVPVLIEQMKIEEGRLAEDVYKSLENLTTRNFGLRIELWERFWNQYKDRYQIPTDEELAAFRIKQAENRAKYVPGSGGGTAYHGIETPSRSVLFVVDVSGSMENEVTEKDRFADGGYPSFSRMDIVKTELARTIEGLEPFVTFNVLAFGTETRSWKKSLVSANVLNKSSASSWIGRLEPLGGNSKSDLAAAGLVQAANLGAGKTNTWGALSWALAVDDGKGKEEYELAVDTVFFLSDGRPTHGRYVDTDRILEEVRKANGLRKVVIHCIAIGEFQKTFMERLAFQNGGIFVDLGE